MEVKYPKGLLEAFGTGFSPSNGLFHFFTLISLLLFGKFGLIFWFYYVLLNFLIKNSSPKKYLQSLPGLLLYLAPIELLGRIIGCSPYIPYEMGKYATFILLLFGHLQLRSHKNGNWGWLIILLSLPGAFLVGPERPVKDLVFNYISLVNMGLGLSLFSNIRISAQNLKRAVFIGIWPSIVLLLYLILISPDLSSIDFELGANFDTTGGFGSNQVSTILGYSFALTGFAYLFGWNFFKTTVASQILILSFFLWGLLSFSRGGIIGGILALLLINIFGNNKQGFLSPAKLSLKTILLFGTVVIGGFVVGNSITDGALLLRYRGETYGTLAGSKDKTINSITTGRFDIFIRDIEIWQQNFLFGAGVGNSDNIGKAIGKSTQITHIEHSRLLAEHGLLGLIIGILIIIIPVFKTIKEKIPLNRAWMIFAFSISIFSTFHSATRTMITPIIFSLAFLKFNN